MGYNQQAQLLQESEDILLHFRKGDGHYGAGAVAASGGPLGGVPLHRARAAVALQRREGRLQGYEAPLRLHRVGPARPLSRTRSLRLHRGENPQLCPGRIDVTVTFNLLGVDGELDGKCEKEQDNAKLRAKRKEKLLCMELNGIIKEKEKN